MTANGDKYTLTIELDEQAIISGFLIVEGNRDKSYNMRSGNEDKTRFHAQDMLSYVGNDPDYSNNPLCNSTPVL